MRSSCLLVILLFCIVISIPSGIFSNNLLQSASVFADDDSSSNDDDSSSNDDDSNNDTCDNEKQTRIRQSLTIQILIIKMLVMNHVLVKKMRMMRQAMKIIMIQPSINVLLMGIPISIPYRTPKLKIRIAIQ
jgi:hypothetical protein